MRKPTGRRCAGILMVALLALAVVGCTRAKPEAVTPTPAASVANASPSAVLAPTVASTRQPAPTALSLTPGPTTISVAQPTATTIPVVAAPVGPTPVPGVAQHTVAWGDTIYSLARRYGTTSQAIIDANQLKDPSLIRVGDVLIIPGAVSQPVGSESEYVVQSGDTLFSIARRFGTTVDEIALANGIVNPAFISVGQTLVIPGATAGQTATTEGTTYVVEAGDTLSSIAASFGKTTWDIVVANNLSDPQTIFVGQILIIP
jgi:peptidoglycan-N-acetylglucosamine deacetylase